MLKINKATWSLLDDIVYNNIALCLYATGCAWKCKGCYNKELWDFNSPDSYNITSDRIIKYITDKEKYLPSKHITVVGLGGDFWYQLNPYIKAMSEIKHHFPEIKVLWYTGAYYENRPSVDLSSIDAILWGKLTNRDGKVYKTLSYAKTNHTKQGEIFINEYDSTYEDQSSHNNLGEEAYAK